MPSKAIILRAINHKFKLPYNGRISDVCEFGHSAYR
jgi:hypothetical protein